jgi:NAD(P)-dependent dehydrogenase (short-subunit alcohol dehydrogenase family)
MSNGPALIVGVGPGLGLALAKAFAADGHAVALFGRDLERLAGYGSQLEADGHTAGAVQADAGDPADLAAALRRAIDELGAPDVLVYNAAALSPDRPTELDAQAWTRALTVNITGAKIAADTVLPLLRDGRGSLLFTGGGLALAPSAEFTSLSVGKAGLRAFAQALHEDQRGSGVHVSSVTIAGYIGSGEPRFEPENIAQAYLDLHHQTEDQWQNELVYD